MDLRFVEAFYWAATLKSVTRAAEKLFVTQSAMSHRIAVLEEELGVALLDRRDKHFRLTRAGERFLARAQRLLELQREIKTELGSDTQHGGALRIGAIESVLHSWLIPWLEGLRAQRPTLELQLTVETTPGLLDLVRRGSLDFVLAALPAAGDGVRTHALPSMSMVFVGNGTLHKRPRYTLAQLAQHELLTFQRGSQPHLALLDTLRDAGLEATRVHTISSISAMVRLVADGFGVATLPGAAIERLAGKEDLRPLCCEAELLPLPIHASWREDPSSGLAEAVVESALRFAGDSGPRPPAHRKNR
jgi:DNA-binding transcriptional LysR family regulator